MVNKNTWKWFYFKDKMNKIYYSTMAYDQYDAKDYVAFDIWSDSNPKMYLQYIKDEFDLSLQKEMLDDIKNDLKEITKAEYEKNEN